MQPIIIQKTRNIPLSKNMTHRHDALTISSHIHTIKKHTNGTKKQKKDKTFTDALDNKSNNDVSKNIQTWPETLHPALRKLMLDKGFHTPTPVQAATIKHFMNSQDVVVQAQTGSGKTLAYLLPLIMKLTKRTGANAAIPYHPLEVAAIVLEPTRELAAQVAEVCSQLLSLEPFAHLRLYTMTGGEESGRAEQALLQNGANILIATPGRLEHTLMHVAELNIKSLEVLIMDEADRLLDMGFSRSLTNILGRLPKQRRTGLFSATLNEDVRSLTKAGLRNPVQIEVQVHYKGSEHVPRPDEINKVIPQSLQNLVAIVPYRQKLDCLAHFIAEHGAQSKIIVFFLTCSQVDYLSKLLPQISSLAHVRFHALHGKMENKKRHNIHQRFVKAENGVLLCTDVAARGIDIVDVKWVLQYDAPQDPAFFVHRIGRTARMGRSGQALTLLAPSEDTYIEFLRIKRVPSELYVFNLEQIPRIVDECKRLALADRAIFLKAQDAFVSFIRAYKEHQCSLIFVFKNLPFVEIAEGMALLHLPVLKDLAHLQLQYTGCHVRPSDIPFHDAALERQRQQQLVIQRERNARERDARQARERAEEEEEQRERKLHLYASSRRAVQRSRTRRLETEWAELQRDARLLKKGKRGRVEQALADRQLAGEALSDSFDD